MSTEAKLDELNKRCKELQKENRETHKLLEQNIIEELDKVQGRSRQNKFEVKCATNQNKIGNLKEKKSVLFLIQKEIRR